MTMRAGIDAENAHGAARRHGLRHSALEPSTRRRPRGWRRRSARRRGLRGPRAACRHCSAFLPSSSTVFCGSMTIAASPVSMPAASSACCTAWKPRATVRISKLVVVLPQVVGAGLEHQLHQPSSVGRRAAARELALLVEHPGHAVRLAEVAAVLGEEVPDLRRRAHAVVGQRLDEDRHAAGAVALVGDLLVASRREARRCPSGSARLMLSAGMLAALAAAMALRRRGLPSGSPPPIAAATVISLISLVKTLAALGVLRRLLVLDRAPLGVSGHRQPSRDWRQILAHAPGAADDGARAGTAPGRRSDGRSSAGSERVADAELEREAAVVERPPWT